MRLFVFKLKDDKILTMDNSEATELSLQDLQQEYLILQVLDLLFRGKDSEGKAYSLEGACRQVGVAPSTWYRWTKEGAIDSHKTALAAQMSASIQDIVIPRYREIFEGLVNLALGQHPPHADFALRITGGDMIKAMKLLMTIIPVNPLTTTERDAAADAEEYLSGAQFGQIFVAGDMNFVYRGSGQPQFGQLEGGDPEIIDQEP
jgi:hypothetical protein